MADHVVTVDALHSIVRVACSCCDMPVVRRVSITLAELNDLAHSHIEAAERVVTESAVRSETEMVDLTNPHT